MRCLLEPHQFQRFPGQGDFAGKEFDICVHCGKTYEVIGGARAENAIYAKPPDRGLLPQVHGSDA